MEAMTDATMDVTGDDGIDERISEAVVTAVAEAKGVDPLDLDPLYSVIDPDALNSLFRPSVGTPPASMELRFSMAGCQVVVRGEGDVVVVPPGASEDGTIVPGSEE